MTLSDISLFPDYAPIIYLEETTSTFDEAWPRIEQGELPLWGSILAKSQSAGRGRMGGYWQSPPGHIYAALRLPLVPPFDGPGAAVALAVILHTALSQFYVNLLLEAAGDHGSLSPPTCGRSEWASEKHFPLKIKWPNDLIYQGGKAGGLLLEKRKNSLVAGIGLNLGQAPQGSWAQERPKGAPPPGALPFFGSSEKLWAKLVKTIILLYNEKFKAMPMREIAKEAEKHLLWLDENVVVHNPAVTPPQTGAKAIAGRLKGLGEKGNLIIQSLGQNYDLWSGSLVKAP
ncbi:MAG: biotin--[acetyl-CoA-carboxylase] ligase [Candidatus Adiutrix sp.]